MKRVLIFQRSSPNIFVGDPEGFVTGLPPKACGNDETYLNTFNRTLFQKKVRNVLFPVFALLLMTLIAACSQSESAAALYVVEAKPWRETIRARGEVVSAKVTSLNVPGQGYDQRQVLQMLSDGTRVKKGELIATFEARSTAKELSVAELELMRNALIRAGVSDAGAVNAAQLDTEIAQTTGELELSERYANAANAGISKNELLDKLVDLGYLQDKRGTLNWRESQLEKKAAVELSVTDAQRATISAGVDSRRASLAEMELRAPHDGVLRINSNWDGSRAQVGSSVWAGDDFAALPDLSALIARFSLPQSQADGLKKDQSVRLRVAGSGAQFGSRVVSVGASATIKSRESPVKYIEFDVEITPEMQAAAPLTPGQALSAEVLLIDRQNVLVVPNAALVVEAAAGSTPQASSPSSTNYKVQTADGGWLVVQLGEQGGVMSEIKSGVEAGTAIKLMPSTGNGPKPAAASRKSERGRREGGL